jgi:ribosomal-protein-alanine N-acetyltransferase
MDENKDSEIYTERLYLRKLRTDDTDCFYEIMKKEEVVKWLGNSRGKTRDETKALIEKYAEQWKEKGYGVWGVLDRQTGELLGDCGLNVIKETGEVEILYAFDPKYWGHGYAMEASIAALRHAFLKIKLDRIIVLAKPDNARSKNVIGKLGFKYIGIKSYFDMELLCYEMLRTDALKFPAYNRTVAHE